MKRASGTGIGLSVIGEQGMMSEQCKSQVGGAGMLPRQEVWRENSIFPEERSPCLAEVSDCIDRATEALWLYFREIRNERLHGSTSPERFLPDLGGSGSSVAQLPGHSGSAQQPGQRLPPLAAPAILLE